jgi:hypothetical protein
MVHQIYTERWPCKATYALLLERHYSETPIFHSLRRGDESRAEKLMEAYGIVVHWERRLAFEYSAYARADWKEQPQGLYVGLIQYFAFYQASPESGEKSKKI